MISHNKIYEYKQRSKIAWATDYNAECMPAVTYSEDIDGWIWVSNDEYRSLVSYCPFTGRKGKPIEDHPLNSGKDVVDAFDIFVPPENIVESVTLPNGIVLKAEYHERFYHLSYSLEIGLGTITVGEDAIGNVEAIQAELIRRQERVKRINEMHCAAFEKAELARKGYTQASLDYKEACRVAGVSDRLQGAEHA